MNQLAKYVTPGLVEKSVGLPAGAIDSFAWLLMNEMAKGVTPQAVAKVLEVDVAELDLLADSVTGGDTGINHDTWKACVITIRSISLANNQVIGQGWDALEAMAVNRIANLVSDASDRLSIKDAVAIAALANKAVRRDAGEGNRGGANLSIHARPGGGGEMAFEVQGGNLGSIRMSLSTRVQAQLEQPRVIDAEPKQADRRMLTIEEIRNVKPE